jgi:hypothetical protein
MLDDVEVALLDVTGAGADIGGNVIDIKLDSEVASAGSGPALPA